MERDGFWTSTTFKVDLTKEDKEEIGKPSCPRWELDVIGYRPGDNLLRIVECKSYLDSSGVSWGVIDPSHRNAGRYKLFHDRVTREVVFRRLVAQLVETKAIQKNPDIQLCLAAGNIVKSKAADIQAHFDANEWHLFGPGWIREQLTAVAGDGYDNAIAAVTAKLLLRE